MFRAILVVMTLATAGLTVAAVFFCGEGPVDEIDAAAMRHYRQGQFQKALEVWQTGLERYPDSAKLHYRIGTILAVRGSFKRAATHLERAAALAPEDPEKRKELALCYLQDERCDDAERELRTVLKQAEWFPEAHYFLGSIYEKRGEHKRAMQEYVEELNVNPECAYAWAKVQQSGDSARDQRRSSWLWVAMTAVGVVGVLVLLAHYARRERTG